MTTVTEEVADVVEAVSEQALETLVVVRQNRYLLAGCAAAGLVVGGVAGYFFAKKRLEEKYEYLANQEVEEAKVFYARVAKNAEKPATPTEMLEDKLGTEAVAALREYKGEALIRDAEAPVEAEEDLVVVEDSVTIVTEHNVFSSNDKWDYELEFQKRTEFPDEPYIVSKLEFFTNEASHAQVTISYFEADDTLVAENDQPIMDTDSVVGDANMIRFGHGSGDKNIVYVRNERLECDYEIVRHSGSFTEEVLGFIQHSETRGPRRFREFDE